MHKYYEKYWSSVLSLYPWVWVNINMVWHEFEWLGSTDTEQSLIKEYNRGGFLNSVIINNKEFIKVKRNHLLGIWTITYRRIAWNHPLMTKI